MNFYVPVNGHVQLQLQLLMWNVFVKAETELRHCFISRMCAFLVLQFVGAVLYSATDVSDKA